MKADAEGARIEQDTFVNSQQHSSMKYLGGGGATVPSCYLEDKQLQQLRGEGSRALLW